VYGSYQVMAVSCLIYTPIAKFFACPLVDTKRISYYLRNRSEPSTLLSSLGKPHLHMVCRSLLVMSRTGSANLVAELHLIRVPLPAHLSFDTRKW
jgi:hypothetical protein